MRRRVLLVDDEVEIVRVSSDYLEAMGWEPRPCTSLAEAERLVGLPIPFDAAVIDWIIEGGSARRLIERLRLWQPDCRILLTTGHGAELVTEAQMGLPMIRKPYTMRTLAVRLDAICSGMA